MRSIVPFIFGIVCITGCARHSQNVNETVEQTYVHRYGIEVTPEDWKARGKNGQVVTKKRDGVVMTETYYKGKLHGPTTHSYPHSDLIQRTEEFQEGVRVRDVIHYTSGTPKEETKFNGKNNKTVTKFYEAGSPWMVEQYVNDRLTKGEYFTPDNHLEARVDDGYGERVIRDSFGHLVSRDELQNGQIAKTTTFHPNGNPKEVTPYVNNHIEGLRRTFLPDGEPSTMEEWSNDMQHGLTTLFQNGEKISEIPYENGIKEGIERRYSGGKEVVEEITWVAGAKHGPYHTHIGNKVQTDWYHQGKRVNKAMYELLSKPNKKIV